MCAGRGCLGNPGGGPGGTIPAGGAGVLTCGPSSRFSSGFYAKKVVSKNLQIRLDSFVGREIFFLKGSPFSLIYTSFSLQVQ